MLTKLVYSNRNQGDFSTCERGYHKHSNIGVQKFGNFTKSNVLPIFLRLRYVSHRCDMTANRHV